RESLRDSIFKHLPPQVFHAVVAELDKTGKIVLEKGTLRHSSHQTNFSTADAELRERIVAKYRDNSLAAAKLDELLDEIAAGNATIRTQARKLFQLLVNEGKIVKVTDEFYFPAEEIAKLRKSLETFAASSDERLIDVPAFKELAGISRKYAIPLLEYFDRERITVRVGDKRKVL
ncbi:MAG: SelB C-terminal domain-containing protein, partial [Acidobacteria bacterium]|nr:SelB C-terminal domain-containing protein [Acidobacteriota bacterium]